MAKSRKQVSIDGILYQRVSGSSGRYQQVDNPQNTISRRQAEKGLLQQQGFKSFEEKAKKRKELGIPKGFRQEQSTVFAGRTYYKKYAYTITELKEEMRKINNDKFLLYVVAIGRFDSTGKTGQSLLEKGKTLQQKRAITSWSTPASALKSYNFKQIKAKLRKEGYLIDHYQIIFTTRKNT